ncbi:MAG: hypothetical protein AAB735_00460 [Patescibacteria group bacterium]
MNKNLVNITSSRWDGKIKAFTELCLKCKFYREINGEDRCYWGVAYKVLDRIETLSYCQLIKKPSPRLEILNSRSKVFENVSRG